MDGEETLATKALSELTTFADEDIRTVIEMLMEIIRNPKATYRAKCVAARVLVQYKRLNLDAIRTSSAVDEKEVREQLEAFLEQAREARHS